MRTALVCIAKNEDNYIEEWISYNFKLGFDDIFVYANDWHYSSNDNRVKIIKIDGKNKQTIAYNNFLANNNFNYNWAAFFDVDEFLVLKQHDNIKSFLADYNDCNSIGINWAIFGNNNHTTVDTNYSVLSRFTKRSRETHVTNKHVKSIVKLPSYLYQDIHNVRGSWFNLNKEVRYGPFNEPVDWSVAQINHYFTKSNEEFLIKCNRGRADMEQKRLYNDYMSDLYANDIEDLKAFNLFCNSSTSNI